MSRRSKVASGPPIEQTRYCKVPGCGTPLSIYNKGERCFRHQPGEFCGLEAVVLARGTVQFFGE